MKRVYQGQERTFYCDCPFQWQGKTGGAVDIAACGYQIYSKQQPPSDATVARAMRIEAEHLVPISWLGRQRQCWQQGGRKQCQQSDPVFRKMEGDPHNLVPAIGQVNGLRSDFKYGMLATPKHPQFGQCPMVIDSKAKIAMPKADIRGDIARVYFYMVKQYGLKLAKQDQQLLQAWAKQDPVDHWERQRAKRIANLTGLINPYVETTQGSQQKNAGTAE